MTLLVFEPICACSRQMGAFPQGMNIKKKHEGNHNPSDCFPFICSYLFNMDGETIRKQGCLSERYDPTGSFRLLLHLKQELAPALHAQKKAASHRPGGLVTATTMTWSQLLDRLANNNDRPETCFC